MSKNGLVVKYKLYLEYDDNRWNGKIIINANTQVKKTTLQLSFSTLSHF